MKYLRKSGESKISLTDADARFLRERGRFVLGYTAEIAVSQSAPLDPAIKDLAATPAIKPPGPKNRAENLSCDADSNGLG